MGAGADADPGIVAFMFTRAEADVDAGDAGAGTCTGPACVRPSWIPPSWVADHACPCARAGMKPDPPLFTPPDAGDDASARPEAGAGDAGDCRDCARPADWPA